MEKEKFRCDLCDVIYTTNIKLINHKKKIHNIENDLKYSNCKFCEFKDSEELCPKEKRNTLPF